MISVDLYAQAPGQCAFCGGVALPAIDTFREQFFGVQDYRIYVCIDCIRSMAQLTGADQLPRHVVSRSDYETAVNERDALLAELEETKATLAKALDGADEVAWNRLLARIQAEPIVSET